MSILSFLLPFLVELFAPSPRIVLSEQTTVVTSPLAEDGLPDYRQFWRDYGRDGVTFENNAAVPFWQAIWPGQLQAQEQLPMSQALGFTRTPATTNALRDPYEKEVGSTLGVWLTAQYQEGLSATESDALLNPKNQELIAGQMADKLVDLAIRGPWTSQEIPPLAGWLANSDEAFQLLHEAARRPKWWSPSPSLLEGPYKGAIYISLPGVQSLRGATRALALRSMWHVGEGRPEDAWADLKTCFQLARLCGKGVTLIEQLVAIASDHITCQRVAVFLHHSEPDADFARQVLAALNSLKVPSDVTRAVDEGERIFFADLVVTWTRDGLNLVDVGIDDSVPVQLNYLNYLNVDWNYVLRQGTTWYDRVVEAMRKPTREERRAALGKVRMDLIDLSTRSKEPQTLLAAAINSDARSARIADVLVSLMLPALEATTKAEERARTELDLTRTAAALAVYRAEQGEYPEKLEQLVPIVVSKVPVDLYSDQPFVYERKPDGGYLLYSVFENGMDDGGTDRNGDVIGGEWYMGIKAEIPDSSADLVIRMPVPEFEMPPRPAFAK